MINKLKQLLGIDYILTKLSTHEADIQFINKLADDTEARYERHIPILKSSVEALTSVLNEFIPRFKNLDIGIHTQAIQEVRRAIEKQTEAINKLEATVSRLNKDHRDDMEKMNVVFMNMAMDMEVLARNFLEPEEYKKLRALVRGM